MSTTGVYEGSVKIFGGSHTEGEEIRRAKVTTSGSTFKLAQWSPERGMYQQVDFLDQATVTDKGGKSIFLGTSRQMTEEIGLAAHDAQVTWEMKERTCKDCR